MSFETMGTSAAQLAATSKPLRGRLVPKKSGVSSSDYPEGKKSNRGNVLERQGATMHPVMSHVKQIDPCASSVGRAMYNIPSTSSKSGSFGAAVTRASSR
jgi:hypothetical protein